MTNLIAVKLHEGAEPATGSGDAVDLGSDRTIAQLTVSVSALTGTLDLTIETSLTQQEWTPVAVAPQFSAPGELELFAINCKRWLRASWVLAGGPTTFLITGEAHQTYIDARDMQQAFPVPMFEGTPPDVLARAMFDATDEAASYLRAFYAMPLKTWDRATRMHVANMAFYHAMQRRGYDVEADPNVRQVYLDALAWLKGPARYAEITDSTGKQEVETEAYIVSGPTRGWGPM